jgi:hypothetical protein
MSSVSSSVGAKKNKKSRNREIKKPGNQETGKSRNREIKKPGNQETGKSKEIKESRKSKRVNEPVATGALFHGRCSVWHAV